MASDFTKKYLAARAKRDVPNQVSSKKNEDEEEKKVTATSKEESRESGSSSTKTAKAKDSFTQQYLEKRSNRTPTVSKTATAAPSYKDTTNHAEQVQEEEQKASGWEIAKNAVMSGMGQFNRGWSSTLDFFLPTELLFGGEEKDPISKLNRYYSNLGNQFDTALSESVSDRSKGTQYAAELGKGTISAIPQAVLALMSGGGSVAAQGSTMAANTSGGLVSAVANATRTLLKNPSFYMSAMQTIGPDYEEAKADGASEIGAMASALISGYLNAGIEVGGGLETLPTLFKEGGNRAITQWVKSALEEGREEVVQGVVSGIVSKAMYDRDRAWFSTEDDDAIINPMRMLEEYAMGSAVGGILGGAQMGTISAVNAGLNAANNRSLDRIGNEFSQMGGDEVQAVIEEGLATDPATESHKLAQIMQEKISRGETVTDREIGELYRANVENVDSTVEASSTEDVEDVDNVEPAVNPSETADETLLRLARESVTEQTNVAQPVTQETDTVLAQARRSAMQEQLSQIRETKKRTVDSYGYGESGTKAFTDVLEKTGVTPEEARTVFQTPYELGLSNTPREKLTFDNDVQLAAYDAGRMDAIVNMHKTPSTSTAGAKSGFHSVNAPKDVSQTHIKIIDDLARELGSTVEWDDGDYNGRILEDGSVRLSRSFNRTYGGETVTAVFHAAHEIGMHRLMQLAPQEGQAFINAMYGYLSEGRPSSLPTLAEAKTDYYGSHNVKLTTPKAMEEVVANSILDLYDGDIEKFHEAVRRVAQGDDVQAKKGLAKFKKILADIAEKLRRMVSKLTGKERAEAKQALSEIEKLRNMYEEALSAAVKQNRENVAKRDGKVFRTASENGMETVETSVGNPVMQTYENGNAQLSLKTYEAFGRAELKRWLDQRVSKGLLVKADAAEILRQLDEYYDICQTFKNKYAPFGAWSNASVVTDNNGKPVFSVVKANGEYAMNLDFSLVCKKRRTLDAVFGEMIRRGMMDNVDLGQEDISRINDIIRESGFETACALCFVDAKRYRQAQVADSFVNQYNELVRMLLPGGDVKAHHFDFVGTGNYKDGGVGLHTIPDAQLKDGIAKLKQVMRENSKLTVAHKIAKHLLANPQDRKLVVRGEFMNTDGFGAVRVKNERVLSLYNSSKGSGGPKAAFSDVQYLGEILKKNNFTPERAYAVGGVRIQSFSDYVPRLVFDYLQMIGDLSAKGLPAHAYTKEAMFAMQFGMTGIKVNMSLVPAVAKNGVAPGLDANGDYLWFDGQSFGSDVNVKGSGKTGYDLAVKIQNAAGYSANCGTIAVGVSNAHIEKMLDDPNIRMVIPYHKSSLNHIIAVMNNIDQYEDYTTVQNTRSKATGTKISGKDFNFNEALRKHGDAKAAANEYLAWCEKNGYIPKFDDFAKHENYYKLLEDFSTYDGDEAAPQGAVTMTFPKDGSPFGSMADLIEQGLEEDAILEGKRDKMIPQIVDKVGEVLKAREQYSLKEADVPVKQDISSAKTSIMQIPALFKDKNVVWGKTNIDIGGGRFDLAKDYLAERGTKSMIFDPYNRGTEENSETLAFLQSGKRADTATCANVLNVIAEKAARSNVILETAKAIKPDGTAYFMVYEGNGTGEGRVTSAGWQNNRKTADYVGEISEWFETVQRKGKLIIAKDPVKNLPKAAWEVQPGEAVMYSLKEARQSDPSYAPVFYSNMEKTIAAVKQDKLGASSVIPMLKGKGVKAEEIKWSGIEEFLSGKKSVTKQELIDFVRANDLVIEENLIEDTNEVKLTEADRRRIDGYRQIREEAIAEIDRLLENGPLDLHAEWQASKDLATSPMGTGRIEASDYRMLRDAAHQYYHEELRNRKEKEPTSAEFRVIVNRNDDFGFDHWPDAIAAIRRDPERFVRNYEMDEDDKQFILDYAELQKRNRKAEREWVNSDEATLVQEVETWADDAYESFSAEQAILNKRAKPNTHWKRYSVPGGKNYRELLFVMPGSDYYNDAMEAHWAENVGVLAHARVQDFKTVDGKMLFIEEIQSDWHNEGHKRGYRKKGEKTREMIGEESRKAYEEFYSTVEGFVFNNSDWMDDNETFYVHPVVVAEMFEGDESQFDKLKFTDEQRNTIRRLVSEEAAREEAKKTAPSAGSAPDAPYSDTYHEFVLKRLLRMAAEDGYDSIGWTTADIQSDRWSDEFAEGYRIEYDQDIPKFLNKYGKKWGAKVEKTDIQTKDLIFEEEVNLSVTADMLEDGDDYIRKQRGVVEIWSMPITNAMRDSVLYEGQPQYSLKDSEGNELSEAQAEFFKDSKVRDEKGNLRVMWHGTASDFTVFDIGRAGRNWGGDSRLGKGFYFADTERDARRWTDGSKVVKAYLNIVNPLDIDAPTPKNIAAEIDKYIEKKIDSYDERGAYITKEQYISNLQRIKEMYMKDVAMFVDEFKYDENGKMTDGIREFLSGLGYDGIVSKNETVAFYPEQIKRTDNLNPTGDPDIRYSLKEDDKLLRENAKLKEVNAALKEQFKLTKVAKVDKKSLDAFAKSILKDYQSGADIVETRQKLDELFTYIANGEGGQAPVWEDVWKRAYDTAAEILENASVLDDEMWQSYKGLRDTLRTTGVSLDKRYESDLGGYENLNEFRKANYGRILIKNDGIPVDSFFQELAYTYPEYFDADETTHPAEQLLRMEEVLNELAPTQINPFAHNMREAATWLASDIIDRFYELPQAKPTFADKADRKLTEQKIKAGKKLEALREKNKEKIRKLIEESREKLKTVRADERAKRQKAVGEVKEHYKTKEAKASENRKASVLRGQIIRHVQELQQTLLKPNDKHHIPENLRKPVAELLEAINLESQYVYDPETGKRHKDDGTGGDPTRRTIAFDNLRKVYKQIIDDDGSDVVVDPYIELVLERMSEYRDVKLADMNRTQLEEVWSILRFVEHSVLNAGKTLSSEKFARTVEWANAMQEDTETRRKMRGKRGESLRLDLENPYTFFSHYGDAGKAVYRMLRDAQDRQQMMVNAVAEKVGKIVDPKTVRKLEKEVHTFKTDRGETLTLTKAHIMDIYLLSKREQAQEHLLMGGIVQPEVKTKGIKRGTDAVLLSIDDLTKIVGKMTVEERTVAIKMQEMTRTLLADYGNEASMKAYGYKKFTGDDYWPIKSAKEGVHSNIEKGAGNTRSIKNIGLAKAVMPMANNPLDIGGIFQTFASHAADMTDYAAWLCPMEDANRLFNFQFRDEDGNRTGKTIKGLLDAVGGKNAQQYWHRLMEDIQNGIKPQTDNEMMGAINKVIGNARGASVGANIRVIVQQPTAMLRAAMVLSPVDMAKGMIGGGGWKTALAYSPIAQRKDMGGFDISSPMQMQEILYDSKTIGQKFNDAMMWGAGKADSITWGRIWSACEASVKRKNKDLKPKSAEFYKAVNDLFTEVIDQSQVVDGVLQRTQAMRSSNALMNQATAFMGEPMMSMNMLLRAYDGIVNEKDGKKRGKAIKNFGRAAVVLAVTNAVNALAQSLIDAIRDDEDDEYWNKFWAAFFGVTGEEETAWEKATAAVLGGNLGSNMNPITYIPFAKDALSLLQGYNVTRADADVMGDIIDSFKTFTDSVLGDGTKTIGKASFDLTKTVLKVFGNSAPNIERDIMGLLRTIAIATDNVAAQYEMEKWIYKVGNEKNTNRFVDIMYKAYESDKYVYEHIYRDLMANGLDAEKIKTRMETKMKKAQGVTKVSDLESRYLPPDQQNAYDGKMKTIQSSNLWKNASADQRDELESNLYDLTVGNGSGEDLQEKIDAGSAYGIDEAEYLLYRMALDMADTPNKNGKLGGTPTNAEKADAISMMGKMSNSELAYLWDTEQGYEAYAEGVDMKSYINALGDGYSVNLEKLVGAKENGIHEDTYFDFLDMLDEYDQPTESGKLGTFTQAEATAAIAAMPGLTDEQRAWLWQSVNKGWKDKNNPWR